MGGEALLGPEDLHLSMFTSAAQGHLADAFAAGTVFAGATDGDDRVRARPSTRPQPAWPARW